MATYRSTLLIQRLRKALKILSEKGPLEFLTRTKEFLQRRGRIDLATNPRKTLEYDTAPVRFTGKKLDQDSLALALGRLASQPFSLAISQDDYLQVVGGVQLKVADQQKEMNELGQSYLHLSPYQVRSTLDFSNQPGVMMVNLDGQHLGFADDETFLAVLSTLIQADALHSIELHHLMGWKLEYIARILKLVGDSAINFWLHDFFSICPNYPLLRNDREYCHAPDPQSNACQLCLYGSIRPLHYQAFNDLLRQFPIHAVAPSEFALELWRDKFPLVTSAGQVVPNAKLEWGDRLQETRDNQPLRIAFVGYPVLHKGWQTWLNLTDKYGKDPRYKFYHFSSDWQPSSNFERVSVEVTRQNRTAMTDALRENRIDIAFLWSICPETFSFTLYESLAAGCTVLTNQNSGNIQAYVKEHLESGLVLESEDALIALFEGGSLSEYLVEAQRDGRKSAKLIVNNTCQDLF